MTTLSLWHGSELRHAFNEYFGVRVSNGSGSQVLGDMADILNAKLDRTSLDPSGTARFFVAFDAYFDADLQSMHPINALMEAERVLKKQCAGDADYPNAVAYAD